MATIHCKEMAPISGAGGQTEEIGAALMQDEPH